MTNNSSLQVSMAMGTNPGSGTLSGTTAATLSGGVATFSSLTINNAGTGYTLVASGSGVTSATSSAFNVTAAGGSGTPAIGSFTDGSATVTPGGYVSLYAKNVSETGSGAIAGVRFYRESNGTSGLQIGSDTYVGIGVYADAMWTFETPTTGLSGTQTYYAVAYDTAGDASSVASVTASVSGSGFSNWSSLQPFLAETPLSIGYIAFDVRSLTSAPRSTRARWTPPSPSTVSAATTVPTAAAMARRSPTTAIRRCPPTAAAFTSSRSIRRLDPRRTGLPRRSLSPAPCGS